VFTTEGELVSHVGIVIRTGTLDGAPVTIGGIGSVKTHPGAQGGGYASAGLRRAATALRDVHHVAFSLLVCQEHLVPFYSRLGWRPFMGRLLVEQPTGPTVFTINRPMVLPGLNAEPGKGTIDLKGWPW
jgi:hypothetical protein